MTTAEYKRAYQQGYSDAQRDFREKPKTEWHIARGMYEDRFWCSCGYIKIIDSNMNGNIVPFAVQ